MLVNELNVTRSGARERKMMYTWNYFHVWQSVELLAYWAIDLSG
jgi:hypothetical protein